ncbi:hypothetical protein OG422_04890 [Streptomyces sp. NBC_01525]|uniref:Uncharacterized protein n=1 Tax=Streptomyces benahoarensis TaxID=2595054 RepID=A0A553ZMX8_9ACTN|nr:hypothetical protein [Streptomyces benahoarensis]TSB24946.1 hypothetical protein FNJ62_13620 [Streptomyces benahoarensis]TSB42745.1 hypothetical protein FNZ23_08250 [Streptomyces benahoarensis]
MADDKGTVTFTKATLEGFRTNELTHLREGADQARVLLQAFQGANKLLPGGTNYQPAVDLSNRFKEAATALLNELTTAYNLSDKMMVQLLETSTAMSNIEDENTQLTAQQLQEIIGSALAAGGKGSGGSSGGSSGGTQPPGSSSGDNQGGQNTDGGQHTTA